MIDDKLERIFGYLKIKKCSVFATKFFIIPMIIALPNYILAIPSQSIEAKTVGLVTAVAFTLVGIVMSLSNEADKKNARKKCMEIIDKYGVENVYRDFDGGDIFLGDKLCIGDKFVFAYRQIFEIENILGFECRKISVNFIPVAYELDIKYTKKGKNDIAAVGLMNYFTHNTQIAEICGNFIKKSPVYAEYFDDIK